MATKTQKIKLGIFILVAAAVGVAMLVVFTTASPFHDTVTYYVRVPDATGLEVGSQVNVRGVRVGSVDALELEGGDFQGVRLVLEVDRGVRIDADAAAYLEYKGVTGLKVVNIGHGTGAQGVLEPGSYIPYGKTLLDRLPDRAEQLMVQTEQLLEAVTTLVKGLGDITDELDTARVDNILTQTERMMGQLAGASGELEKLLEDTRVPLTRSVESTDRMLEQMDQLTTNADDVLANMNRTIVEIHGVVRTNDATVKATLRNLRRASESFESLARELRRRPNLLLFSDPPEERKLP